jgi:hypothetical protein
MWEIEDWFSIACFRPSALVHMPHNGREKSPPNLCDSWQSWISHKELA